MHHPDCKFHQTAIEAVTCATREKVAELNEQREEHEPRVTDAQAAVQLLAEVDGWLEPEGADRQAFIECCRYELQGFAVS